MGFIKTYSVQAVLWMHQGTRSGHGSCWHRKWNLSLEKAVLDPGTHVMGCGV